MCVCVCVCVCVCCSDHCCLGSPFSLPQDVVLMRALRDMNLPKFVFEDVPLFLGLISDLFPGLDCPRVRYPNFNDAVEAVLDDNKYIRLPHQVMNNSCLINHIAYPSFLLLDLLSLPSVRWTRWCSCMRPC